MVFAIVMLLAALAIAFVTYPLLARRYRYDLEDVFALGDTKQLNYLNSKKALVLENVKELDFEYEMGKLSDGDYARLRAGYLAEAEGVLQALDQLKIREEIEELIEGEVRTRRRTE
jgi:hypothetical protein